MVKKRDSPKPARANAAPPKTPNPPSVITTLKRKYARSLPSNSPRAGARDEEDDRDVETMDEDELSELGDSLLERVVRVLVQISAVLLMYYGANLSLSGIGNPFGLGEIMLGPVALIGTVVVGITVINAYNLIDGIDGLAGTIVVIQP